jgi:hypothetical protein
MDEFDGFFDAAEEAPGFGVGFEDEDEHARLDAGRLNFDDVGAGNVAVAVLAAGGEFGRLDDPPFIVPHDDVHDGVVVECSVSASKDPPHATSSTTTNY